MRTLFCLFSFFFFASCIAQTPADDAIFIPENCPCRITHAMLNKMENGKEGEITEQYPGGQLKYREVKRRWKTHITCYQQNGIKCKEVCLNFKTKIQKSKLYDTNGKKYMVCKGRLKY